VRPATITALQSSIRCATAAGLAVAIARMFEVTSPINALMSAVIVTDLSPATTRRLAGQRLAGTAVGAVVGAMFTYAQPQGPVIVGVGILVAMLAAYALRLPEVAKLAGFVSGIVLMPQNDANAWPYVMYRVAETLIGIAMGVLVSMVPKLMRLKLPSDSSAS
jgi:uncharacterized membrane protein YgaE (UPF0421/DUF939 family)